MKEMLPMSAKSSGGVQIKTAEGDVLEGTFCIAADGINSRLAKITGLNKERLFINTRKSISHYVTGVEFERSEAIFLGISWDSRRSRARAVLPAAQRVP